MHRSFPKQLDLGEVARFQVDSNIVETFQPFHLGHPATSSVRGLKIETLQGQTPKSFRSSFLANLSLDPHVDVKEQDNVVSKRTLSQIIIKTSVPESQSAEM